MNARTPIVITVVTSPWSSQAAGGSKLYTAEAEIGGEKLSTENSEKRSPEEAVGDFVLKHAARLGFSIKYDDRRPGHAK